MRLPPPRPPRESRADARNIESAVSSPTESGSRGVTVAWLPVAVVAGLVVATAVAFVQTERLKLVPSPILDTVVSKSFGPH
jgi:sporulation-control protein spo0M